MAENSDRRRRHTTTPARSEYVSNSSFSTSSSYIFPHLRGPARGAVPTPASPFATDDDKSWKAELSWQFEPSGWQENRDLGAAFSPWTSNNSSAASRGRIFKKTANDYFLSRTYGGMQHTYGGMQSFGTSFQDFSRSGYDLGPVERLELQSYVGRSSHGGSRPNASPVLSSIKEGSRRHSGSLIDNIDDTSAVDHGLPQDIDRQIRLIKTYRDLKEEQDPRWFSVSHAYMEENDGKTNDNLHSQHQSQPSS